MQIVWGDAAERTLLEIPVDEANAVLDAVEHMAATGRGFVRNMLDDAGTLGLYAGDYVIFFVIDENGVLHVRRVRKRH